MATNDHLCCAERNLVSKIHAAATRHGVPMHKRVAWMRRKFGGHMTVWRPLSDGTLGCSIPCVICRKVLLRMHVTVHAVMSDGATWFHGQLSDQGTPRSKPTSGQVRKLHFSG